MQYPKARIMSAKNQITKKSNIESHANVKNTSHC